MSKNWDIENGTFKYMEKGTRWSYGQPCLMVKCEGGWLIAFQSGDPGLYDEIAVDFVADDNRCLQMVTVGMSEGDTFMPEAQDEPMHVYVWDGVHEDVQHEHYVHIGEDSYWYGDKE